MFDKICVSTLKNLWYEIREFDFEWLWRLTRYQCKKGGVISVSIKKGNILYKVVIHVTRVQGLVKNLEYSSESGDMDSSDLGCLVDFKFFAFYEEYIKQKPSYVPTAIHYQVYILPI